MIAFWALDTERSLGGNMVGHIPWSKARSYARDVLGWSGPMLGIFWRVVREMDSGYMSWMKGEFERHTRNAKRSKPTPSGKTTERRMHQRPIDVPP